MKAIADPKFMLKSPNSIQMECLEFLIREHTEFAKKAIERLER